MLYLMLIVIPAAIGLLLGFGLPKIAMALWRYSHDVKETKNNQDKERRVLCIR